MESCSSILGQGCNLEQASRNDDKDTVENDFCFGTSNAPTFYETIPTLQEMSSMLVAITLWRRVINLQDNIECDADSKIYDKEVEKLLLELPAPNSIREMVKNHSPAVKNEMKNWLRYYELHLANSKRGADEENTSHTGDLLFCCWLPNGKIDYRMSALNMLSNPRLTQGDKFAILGTYCLEDEMKKLSVESLPANFTEHITLRKNALMYYWLCYVKGNLDKIPKIKGESIVSHLISAFYVDNWPAIEYFWHQLNVDEQTSKLEEILKRKPKFQKNLFSKMSESQKRLIFSKIPIKIMENFWRLRDQERFALQTWIYIRNLIDYNQFKKMMRMLTTSTSPKKQVKADYLLKIWQHCPDHLKNLGFQPAFANVIMDFHANNFYYPPFGDIEFLMTYLSEADAETRKRIIFDETNALVGLLFDGSFTDQLFKLCLPNANDVVEFKKNVLEANFTRDRLYEASCDNDFEKLNLFLCDYCPDWHIRSEFCSKMIELFTVKGYAFNEVEKWINVMKFIDENLLNNLPHQALKLKKRIALSFSYWSCQIWSNDDKMAKMIEIVTQVLDAEELQRFKRIAVEQVQARYKWEQFDENVIRAFLSWCCDNDDHAVREFKKTLSIDKIFEQNWDSIKRHDILQTDVNQEIKDKLFEPWDKCLLWYFEDSEKVTKFKLEKVFEYCDERGGSMFFLYIFSKNDVFTRNTLPWFFESDQGAIELFKEKYKDKEIGRMI